jgi:hypothetical protein
MPFYLIYCKTDVNDYWQALSSQALSSVGADSRRDQGRTPGSAPPNHFLRAIIASSATDADVLNQILSFVRCVNPKIADYGPASP